MREGLSELLGDPLYSLLMDEEGISVVELLSAYQDYLLEQIEYVENCNLTLQEELKNGMLARHAALTEHLDLYGIQQLWSSCGSLEDFEDGLEQMRQSHSSSHRRSTVNELMNEPNEDNYDAYFNENHSGNARMRSYVAKLEQTTKH